MIDATEAHDAVLRGVSRYVDWKRKFLADWNEGIQKGQVAAIFATIPPELKEVMKKVDPEQYAQVQSALAQK